MKGLAFLMVIVGTPLTMYTTTITFAYLSLKKRMKGLNEPELWLPKSERQEHARKLLRREDEQYIQQMIERQTQFINKEN